VVELRGRALGAFYGLAVGDALGMPTQFLSRRSVRELFGDAITGFEPGPAVNEISAGMPAGRVTDDTEQAVILAQTLLDGHGTVDQRLLADRLLSWERQMIGLGSADLLGPSTRRALQALTAGGALDEVGRWGDTNGAAMRITPVGIAVGADPLAKLCLLVAEASRLTHGTGVALGGACAVAAAVSAGVEGADRAAALDIGVDAAGEGARLGRYTAGADVATRIGWAVGLVEHACTADTLDLLDRLIGTGVATQESVPAAFALVARFGDDPWAACLQAASLGGDSDTIAAMVGAMTGALHGVDAFPAEVIAVIDDVNRLGLTSLVDGLLRLRKASG
jgi:ADP-ribosylglycohydrolase